MFIQSAHFLWFIHFVAVCCILCCCSSCCANSNNLKNILKIETLYLDWRLLWFSITRSIKVTSHERCSDSNRGKFDYLFNPLFAQTAKKMSNFRIIVRGHKRPRVHQWPVCENVFMPKFSGFSCISVYGYCISQANARSTEWHQHHFLR